MTDGGSIVAMSYYGAEKVVPHYNVMGVAKASLGSQHALSRLRSGSEENSRQLHQRWPGEHAGRTRHLRFHARWIKHYEAHAPLKRTCRARRTRRDRRHSSPATARRPSPVRCIYVDGGYQIMGM